MKRILFRFRQFGGIRLIRDYTRMGLLPLCFKQAVAIFFRKKKPIEGYSCILEQAGAFLKKKYGQALDDIEPRYSNETKRSHSPYVWLCWLKGMEKAPKKV